MQLILSSLITDIEELLQYSISQMAITIHLSTHQCFIDIVNGK